MITLEQRDEVEPICPHCERPLANVWFQELRGILGRRYVYFCARCHKCLGISHRKGFMLG